MIIRDGTPKDDIYAHMWWNITALSGHENPPSRNWTYRELSDYVDFDYVMYGVAGSLPQYKRNASQMREIIESKMTFAAIHAAQKRARDCVASNYKGC